MADPRASFENNTVGTFNLLMAARQAGVRRVVFAASSSAYGANEELPKRESMAVLPMSPYAADKAAGELYVATFARAFGLQTVCLRYFNVFGPRQDPMNQYAGVIAAFATAMIRGQRPTIFGDGTQSRDFTFVENVVQANLLAAEAPKVAGETVNVGCGQAIDLNRMVEIFNGILGTHLQSRSTPRRAPATSSTRWPTSRPPAPHRLRAARPCSRRACGHHRLVPPRPRNRLRRLAESHAEVTRTAQGHEPGDNHGRAYAGPGGSVQDDPRGSARGG